MWNYDETVGYKQTIESKPLGALNLVKYKPQ